MRWGYEIVKFDSAEHFVLYTDIPWIQWNFQPEPQLS